MTMLTTDGWMEITVNMKMWIQMNLAAYSLSGSMG